MYVLNSYSKFLKDHNVQLASCLLDYYNILLFLFFFFYYS